MQSHKIYQANYKGKKLYNIVVPNMAVSIVSSWFRAGSRFDYSDKEGLAHFFEHLLFKKTKKYPSEIKRLMTLEEKGIIFNAQTNLEGALYWHISSYDRVEDSLAILDEGINNSIFSKELVQKEKNIIKEEELMNRENPDDYIYRLINNGLWPEQNVGKDIFGSAKSLNKININDIEKFYKERYKDYFYIIITPKKIKGYKLKKPIFKKLNINNFKISYTKIKKINIEKRGNDRVVVAVSFRTTDIFNEDDCISLFVVRDYLANFWSARLQQKLRIQNNYTYWIEGEAVNLSDAGAIRFIYSCDKKVLNKTLAIVLNEIDSLKKKLINKKDLHVTKNIFKSAFEYNLSNVTEIMWWYGWQLLFGIKPVTGTLFLKKLKLIDGHHVKKTANRYLKKDNLSISIIGNINKQDINLPKNWQ